MIPVDAGCVVLKKEIVGHGTTANIAFEHVIAHRHDIGQRVGCIVNGQDVDDFGVQGGCFAREIVAQYKNGSDVFSGSFEKAEVGKADGRFVFEILRGCSCCQQCRGNGCCRN